jgi:hypothetical protein
MIKIIDEAIDETMNIYQCDKCDATFALWIKRPCKPWEHPSPGYESEVFVEPKYCPECGREENA